MIRPYTELNDLLKKDLKIFIIVGNDDYLISSSVSTIINSYPNDEITRFDTTKLDEDALRESFFTYPFFMQNRLIVIENFNLSKLSSAQSDLFESLLSSVPDFLTVILTNPPKKPCRCLGRI